MVLLRHSNLSHQRAPGTNTPGRHPFGERMSDASLETVIAGLARAVRIASEELPELVEYIAPALELLSQEQVAISALSPSKHRALQRMALLEKKLQSCDSGDRAAYVMGVLDLSRSTYYEYRKILEREGLIPDESGKLGLPNADE